MRETLPLVRWFGRVWFKWLTALTGIAGLYLDRKRGVFERATVEVAAGNRVGVAGPVVGELAFRAEGSAKREQLAVTEIK